MGGLVFDVILFAAICCFGWIARRRRPQIARATRGGELFAPNRETSTQCGW
jgi:hypothetical protein